MVKKKRRKRMKNKKSRNLWQNIFSSISHWLVDKVSCIQDVLFKMKPSQKIAAQKISNMCKIENKGTCPFTSKHKKSLKRKGILFWHHYPQQFWKSDWKHQKYVTILVKK